MSAHIRIMRVMLSTLMVSACLLGACTAGPREPMTKSMQLDVHESPSRRVSLDAAYQSAQQQIRVELPNAYFTGMVFSGKCQDLPDLEGKLSMAFLQVRSGLLGREVLQGIASLDTIRNTMTMRFTDESTHYPSLEEEAFAGDAAFRTVSEAIFDHLPKPLSNDCQVTVTQQHNGWAVRCGGLGDFVRQCSFRIVNGKVEDR